MKIKENLDINNPISYMSDKGEMRELGSTDAIENLLKLRPNLRNNKNVGVIEKYTGVLSIIDSVNELQKQGTLKLAMRNLENSTGLSFMKTERDDEDSWLKRMLLDTHNLLKLVKNCLCSQAFTQRMLCMIGRKQYPFLQTAPYVLAICFYL